MGRGKWRLVESCLSLIYGFVSCRGLAQNLKAKRVQFSDAIMLYRLDGSIRYLWAHRMIAVLLFSYKDGGTCTKHQSIAASAGSCNVATRTSINEIGMQVPS